jgi:hypothetical protein
MLFFTESVARFRMDSNIVAPKVDREAPSSEKISDEYKQEDVQIDHSDVNSKLEPVQKEYEEEQFEWREVIRGDFNFHPVARIIIIPMPTFF